MDAAQRPARGRVVLADDDVLLREGLASLCERLGYEVVGQAGDGGALLELVAEHLPDLVIVDIRMPPTHSTEGLKAARSIRERHPDLGILVLSAFVEVEDALELLAGGRRIGYLLKSRVTVVDDFIEALDRIRKGGSVVAPSLVRELVSAQRRDDPLSFLSAREREVLELMAEGRSNAGIGRRLWVTEGTVEKHVRSIPGKLHLPEAADDHRRVLAVLTFLESREDLAGPWPGSGPGQGTDRPSYCHTPQVGCETWPTPPATAPSRDRSPTRPGSTGSATSTAG
jgi:serine/threonine-protein kinase PknK